MSDQDVAKGRLKQGEGKLENAYGNVTGDVDHQANGAAKQVAGKVQEGWGRLKDGVRAADENDREERVSGNTARD